MSEGARIIGLIANSVVNFDIEKTKQLCQQALRANIPAYKIMMEGVAKGLRMVGEKFESGEYFLTELVMAGETAKQAFETLKPHFTSGGVKSKGKIIIGSTKGDLHDIGKNIVTAVLTGSGFEVFDLGVDVPAENFVQKAKEVKANIIGISCLLSTTMPSIGEVVEAFERAELRDEVKIIIGGAPTTPEYARKIGADACGTSAIEGVRICETWVEQNERQTRL